MPHNGTDSEQDEGQEQDENLEGMAVEVNSNQIRHEAIPASHHDDKGQQSVVQNEEHSHRSARHEQAASQHEADRD
jgi:hypothetical protein